MHLQQGVFPYEQFVRCIGLGPQVKAVKYDPDQPLHLRYRKDRGFLTDDDQALLRDVTLTINAFFGWDFNSCESLLKDGVWHPIDFANPCPDSQVTSLHQHFPWLIKAKLRWSIFCAVTRKKMRLNLDWAPFFEVAEHDMPYRDKLRAYAAIADERLRDRTLRRVLRPAPGASGRSRLGVLRGRPRARRRAQEGRLALSRARVGRVHRPLLERDPGVARPGRRRAHRLESRRPMTKLKKSWHSDRVGREVTVTRWGEVGTPVLFFPTAAADAEECERFHLVDAVSGLLESGRIKFYSVDSVAGQAWLTEDNSSAAASQMQLRFDAFIYHELVPAIRKDCESDDIEIIATGPSIGAFNALAATCRHPDVFAKAICMSGTYDLRKFLRGPVTQDYFQSSPILFLPEMDEGTHLERLRERFILLTHGDGRWEEPEQSWRTAEILGERGIPNRVDAWGENYDHDWPTWREMLPKYLEELL